MKTTLKTSTQEVLVETWTSKKLRKRILDNLKNSLVLKDQKIHSRSSIHLLKRLTSILRLSIKEPVRMKSFNKD